MSGIDWPGFALAVLLVDLTPGPNMAWLAALTLALTGTGVTTGVHLGSVLSASASHRWMVDPARTRLVRRLLALGLVGVAVWLFVGTAR